MAELIAKLRSGVVQEWIDVRIGSLKPAIDYLSKKTVPRHRASIWYYFGGMTMFFFIIQIVTGLLLLLYYKPTESEAFESYVFIQKEVAFGWLMRQAHSWSANLMILMMFVHMFSAYFMKAYRKPRELMWLSGIVLLLLTLGLGFTGYLLPWTQLAYFATAVGVQSATYAPGGDLVAHILQGGDEVTGETLTRMFSLHVCLLPGLLLLVLAGHLTLMQTLGSSIPIGYKEKGLVKGEEAFFPNFLLKDFIGWMIGFALLIFLCVMSPWEVGEKADPLSAAPAGIKPEWYFWAQFQLLKQVPGVLAIGLMTIAIIAWTIVPFIDRKASREEKSPAFTIFGVLTLGFFLVESFIVYYQLILHGPTH
jgi:cytochrome b6